MKEVFEPVTENQSKQQEFSEKQIQVLPKEQHEQNKAELEQYKQVAIFCKNLLNREYKNMMKLLTVMISFLRLLLIPTKLVLVL